MVCFRRLSTVRLPFISTPAAPSVCRSIRLPWHFTAKPSKPPQHSTLWPESSYLGKPQNQELLSITKVRTPVPKRQLSAILTPFHHCHRCKLAKPLTRVIQSQLMTAKSVCDKQPNRTTRRKSPPGKVINKTRQPPHRHRRPRHPSHQTSHQTIKTGQSVQLPNPA